MDWNRGASAVGVAELLVRSSLADLDETEVRQKLR